MSWPPNQDPLRRCCIATFIVKLVISFSSFKLILIRLQNALSGQNNGYLSDLSDRDIKEFLGLLFQICLSVFEFENHHTNSSLNHFWTIFVTHNGQLSAVIENHTEIHTSNSQWFVANSQETLSFYGFLCNIINAANAFVGIITNVFMSATKACN